jgi:exportin-5
LYDVSYTHPLTVNSQRVPDLDSQSRQARLEAFIQPVMLKWQHPQLANSLMNFEGFCSLLGISHLQEYFIRRNVHTIGDWASVPLDEEGKAMKARIEAALLVS